MEKFGYTAGCPGCRAASRGATATNHTEEHREMLAEYLEKDADEMFAREAERLFEHLKEEEGEQKKAKSSEGSGGGKASASSSGPATVEREAPRSKREDSGFGR